MTKYLTVKKMNFEYLGEISSLTIFCKCLCARNINHLKKYPSKIKFLSFDDIKIFKQKKNIILLQK